jgi:alkyl hydroperoxide reductase subunit F
LLQGEQAVAVRQLPDGLFVTRIDSGREISSRVLILATGKRWRRLQVPGEDKYLGQGVANCAICDAPFFKGRSVVIAGGGNSAVTAAIDMLQLGSPVTIINAESGWQADPVLVERLQGRAGLLDQHRILEILGDGRKVTGVRIAPCSGGPEQVLPVEGVFVEIGLIPNTDIFRGFVDLNEQNEVIVDCASHTSRPGVYAAGDCTTVPEKQIIIAAGDGAKAALAAFKYITYAR